MGESFSFDVFLSHSPQDQSTVRDIAERLRKDGLKVWFDEWVLKPGDDVAAKTEEGLAQSRVLVLCMSANVFGAEWAQLEQQTLRFRDPANRQRRFVPLRLDEAHVEGSLAQFLQLNWHPAVREQDYLRLRSNCRPPVKPIATGMGAGHWSTPEQTIDLHYQKDLRGYAFSGDGSKLMVGGHDGEVRLWNLKEGHNVRRFSADTGSVYGVAWAKDERLLLTGSGDSRVRVWDTETGRCLRVLDGHGGTVWSVAWNAEQRQAVSGSSDMAIRSWDIESGRCLRVFDGHHGCVNCVALSDDGLLLLSGSDDHTVRLWDVRTGECLRSFHGHSSAVWSVHWSSGKQQIVSGAFDATIRSWNPETGACGRVLEGHKDGLYSIACRVDRPFVLSASSDRTVRLWNLETGQCLAVLDGHRKPIRAVAWSADGTHAFSGDERGGIQIWDLSGFLTAATNRGVAAPPVQVAPAQTQYTNAKVLLVGDTGVGKSALAERLTRNEFIQTKSSHARKAYVLESKAVTSNHGSAVHQETVLWDLAGQPAYRLVHQLSMDDATVACVLFDNRSETNPFEAASYWSQVLDQARTSTQLKKLLIASRIDVGGLPAGRERIEAFAKEHGFAAFIPTSAANGEGCDSLLDAIRAGIRWDELPKVTTEGPLAPLRAYVAGLKGERDGRAPVSTKLFTIAQLHEGFSADYGRKIPLDEFIAHLERLEATDAVDLLLFHSTGAKPQSETRVLLDPTRVDAYASALLVAAKDEPDGPGHLLESRVREADFKLDAEERLADAECEKHVLWFVMESLLAQDLALRERIKGQDYFVFPSQCTAELRFPGVASFGVAFGFKGAVRSVYATLIAQLAHYEDFKKREFFQDAAAYRPEAGGRCIVRLRDQGRGQGELELSFEAETPVAIRQGFIEFVGKHLESKSTPGSVTRRHAYRCANEDCRKAFDDAVVKARLEARKKQLLCPYCEVKTPLVDLLASPSAAATSVATRIVTDAKAGRQRMTAGLVIKAKEAQGKFDVFLSHNAKDKVEVEKIAKRLLTVGIRPWLDKWNMSPGDTVGDALEQAIQNIPCAALCFGPADVGKWHIMEIRAYVERWASGSARMIPVVLPDVKETPVLPLFVRQTLWLDMRDWLQPKNDAFYRLVCGILGRAPGSSPMKTFGVRDVAEWQGVDWT